MQGKLMIHILSNKFNEDNKLLRLDWFHMEQCTKPVFVFCSISAFYKVLSNLFLSLKTQAEMDTPHHLFCTSPHLKRDYQIMLSEFPPIPSWLS